MAMKSNRGRPKTFAHPRVNLSIRIQKPMYSDVKKESKQTGKSISRVIEDRLERVRLLKGDMEAMWGSIRASGLVATIDGRDRVLFIPKRSG